MNEAVERDYFWEEFIGVVGILWPVLLLSAAFTFHLDLSYYEIRWVVGVSLGLPALCLLIAASIRLAPIVRRTSAPSWPSFLSGVLILVATPLWLAVAGLSWLALNRI